VAPVPREEQGYREDQEHLNEDWENQYGTQKNTPAADLNFFLYFCATYNIKAETMITVSDVSIGESKGQREYMEDRLFAKHISSSIYAAFVFDGHGGTRAADYLVENVPKLLKGLSELDPPLFKYYLSDMFDTLNEEFSKLDDTSGSTISGVVVHKPLNTAYVLQCGDSQTVMYGGMGANLFVSEKDDLDDAAVRKTLETRHGVSVKKDKGGLWRLEGILNMRAAFGNFHLGVDFGASFAKIQGRTVKVAVLPLKHKRTTVILGSDGIFDEVPAPIFAQVKVFREMSAQQLATFIGKTGGKGDNTAFVRFNLTVD
jgi:serine/threonine protein phosphatase PrpC